MKISIVIPAYREAGIIGTVITSISRLLPDAEIIVVDDGSDDQTAEVARNAGAIVYIHPYNIGNGAAVKTGIRMATGDLIVMLDGDGQHNPEDIPRLLAEATTHDMVVGARDSRTHANIFRKCANTFYNFLASYITKRKVKDLTSGFRVVHRKTAVRYLYLLPNTFSYPTTITLSYLHSGRSICYIPIQAAKRTGKSKIRPLSDGFQFLLIIIKITTLYSPMLIFLPMSLFFMITGLFYYSYTYILTHRFTNMSALLLISSVMIFMLGLISEQITQLRYDRVENNK
jgi:glycosyltransferase involved in cell wall biosynthesis